MKLFIKCFYYFSIVNFYNKVSVFCSESSHYLIGNSYNFNICIIGVNTKNINVELPVFTQSSSLGFFISKKIWYRIPTKRKYKFILFLSYHTGDSWGHFWAQGNLSLSTVSKCIGLFVYYFFSSFCLIQFI